MFGPTYHKINTVFKRDDRGKILPGEFAREEFEYLRETPWRWTEKIDGTNIRLHYTPSTSTIVVGGRTDNAQIPAHLMNALSPFVTDVALFKGVFSDCVDTNTEVTVYGEGYGAKIQKGGGNYRDDQGFIVFDVKVGDWWLRHDDVQEVAAALGMETVPVLGHWTLDQAVQYVEHSARKHAVAASGRPMTMEAYLQSTWPKVKIEGLVGTPTVDLFDRRGDRVVVKLKLKDFE